MFGKFGPVALTIRVMSLLGTAWNNSVKYLELFQGHLPKDIIVKISRVE